MEKITKTTGQASLNLKQVYSEAENRKETKEEEWDRLLQMALDQMQRFNHAKGSLTDCPICNGNGVVMTVVNNRCNPYPYTAVAPCGCLYKAKNDIRVENSGLKQQVEQQSFDTYKADEGWQKGVKEKAEAYTTFDTDKWFYICGNSGTGKTHLCTAITKDLLKKQAVLYMLWRDVTGQLKRLATSPDYDKILDKYKRVEVLYIDDFLKTVNKARPTDADLQIAFELLNYRSMNNLKTIISSEFSLEEVIGFDEATGSRIFEKAEDFYIKLSNKSNYRLN